MKVAIIGTRSPDALQLAGASTLADELSKAGCVIATGGAEGIDATVMAHARRVGSLEVYLPWKDFNQSLIPPHAVITVFDRKLHQDWADSVSIYHPAPEALSRGAFALHARNYGIVKDSVRVIAFPDEASGGGTAQGIRIAFHNGIHTDIFPRGSMGTFDSRNRLQAVLESLTAPVSA